MPANRSTSAASQSRTTQLRLMIDMESHAPSKDRGDHRPYQTWFVDASAEAASALNLHKNPESLQTPFPASARPTCTVHPSQTRRPSRARRFERNDGLRDHPTGVTSI